MDPEYNPNFIEPKWREIWEDRGQYDSCFNSNTPVSYAGLLSAPLGRVSIHRALPQ